MTTPIVPDYVQVLLERADSLHDLLIAVVRQLGGVTLSERLMIDVAGFDLEVYTDLVTRTVHIRAVPRPQPDYDQALLCVDEVHDATEWKDFEV